MSLVPQMILTFWGGLERIASLNQLLTSSLWQNTEQEQLKGGEVYFCLQFQRSSFWTGRGAVRLMLARKQGKEYRVGWCKVKTPNTCPVTYFFRPDPTSTLHHFRILSVLQRGNPSLESELWWSSCLEKLPSLIWPGICFNDLLGVSQVHQINIWD